MESRGNTRILERFAVARLRYTVNELQTQVDHDKNLTPPVRKVFHCIADDSALTANIAGFKRWIDEHSITMTVPFCTLDALDDWKKGTDVKNVNSRETIRYFERCQVKPITGVKLQGPKEMFQSWAECEQFRQPEQPASSESPSSPTSEGSGNGDWRRSGLGSVLPPRWIQSILNCALYKAYGSDERKPGEEDEDPVILVTNHDEVQNWAGLFGIKAVDTATIEQMIDNESWGFQQKKQNYEASLNPTSPTGRSGRSGSFGRVGRGGRGGRRRDSRGSEQPIDPEFSRGNHSAPGYILRGPPPGGVARGRGRLWEP